MTNSIGRRIREATRVAKVLMDWVVDYGTGGDISVPTSNFIEDLKSAARRLEALAQEMEEE